MSDELESLKRAMRRWKQAADTYARILEHPSRGVDLVQLKTRYASALLSAGARADAGKARSE